MSLFDREYLTSLGWNDFFESSLPPGLTPGRVTGQQRSHYEVEFGPGYTSPAQLTGKFRFEEGEWPAVGDWVACELSEGLALIQAVLPRRSCLSRKQAGGERTQVIAANIDVLFIATSLNADLNPRRLERYFTLAWDSGAVPVLVLTKSDLVSNAAGAVNELCRQFPGIDVHSVTVAEPATLDFGMPYLQPGRTAAVVGSSGVGKSTLINAWIGREVLATQSIREDDAKGRHTTTSRHLLVSRWGGLVIDTPGMRELQLLDNEEGLQRTFADIEELALQCRFSDCRHEREPGCAIRSALDAGELDGGRWQSYLKQLAEIRHHLRKTNKAAAAEEKKKWKQIHKGAKQRVKLFGK